MNDEGLADAKAVSPVRLPRLHPGIGSSFLRPGFSDCVGIGSSRRSLIGADAGRGAAREPADAFLGSFPVDGFKESGLLELVKKRRIDHVCWRKGHG